MRRSWGEAQQEHFNLSPRCLGLEIILQCVPLCGQHDRLYEAPTEGHVDYSHFVIDANGIMQM